MVQHSPKRSTPTRRHRDAVYTTAKNAHISHYIGERTVCVPLHGATGKGAKDRASLAKYCPPTSNEVIGYVGLWRGRRIVSCGDQKPRQITGRLPGKRSAEASITHNRARRKFCPLDRVGVGYGWD